MKTRVLRALLPLGLAVGVAAAPRLPVRINFTSSLPRGLYLVTGASLGPGGLGMACLPPEVAAFGLARGYLRAGDCPGGTAPVLKWIAGGDGSDIRLGPEGVRIDGRLLPYSRRRAHDSSGRRLTSAAPPAGLLPPGRVWLHAPRPDSWDSRYYGSVPTDSVLATLSPLLTFPAGGADER